METRLTEPIEKKKERKKERKKEKSREVLVSEHCSMDQSLFSLVSFQDYYFFNFVGR